MALPGQKPIIFCGRVCSDLALTNSRQSPSNPTMTLGWVGLEVQQVASALDARVGWRVGRQDLRITGVMSLAHKNGRDPRAPELLDGGQDAELVVHHYIMRRRTPCFHVG